MFDKAKQNPNGMPPQNPQNMGQGSSPAMPRNIPRAPQQPQGAVQPVDMFAGNENAAANPLTENQQLGQSTQTQQPIPQQQAQGVRPQNIPQQNYQQTPYQTPYVQRPNRMSRPGPGAMRPAVMPPQTAMQQNIAEGEAFGKETLSRNQKIILTFAAFLVAIILLAGAFFLYIYFQKRGDNSIVPNSNINTVIQNSNTSTNTPVVVNSNKTVSNSNVNNGNKNSNTPVNINTSTTNTNTPSGLNTNGSTVTDPKSDADKDGLIYEDEIKYKTNPSKADTDGDGYLDGDEVKNGYNPNGTGKLNP